MSITSPSVCRRNGKLILLLRYNAITSWIAMSFFALEDPVQKVFQPPVGKIRGAWVEFFFPTKIVGPRLATHVYNLQLLQIEGPGKIHTACPNSSGHSAKRPACKHGSVGRPRGHGFRGNCCLPGFHSGCRKNENENVSCPYQLSIHTFLRPFPKFSAWSE